MIERTALPHLTDAGAMVIEASFSDASRGGADWQEVTRIVLHRDPVAEEARSRRCWESHLARAQWLSNSGYRRILEQAVVAAAHGGKGG